MGRNLAKTYQKLFRWNLPLKKYVISSYIFQYTNINGKLCILTFINLPMIINKKFKDRSRIIFLNPYSNDPEKISITPQNQFDNNIKNQIDELFSLHDIDI